MKIYFGHLNDQICFSYRSQYHSVSPQNSYVESPSPKVTVLGDKTFGRWLVLFPESFETPSTVERYKPVTWKKALTLPCWLWSQISSFKCLLFISYQVYSNWLQQPKWTAVNISQLFSYLMILTHLRKIEKKEEKHSRCVFIGKHDNKMYNISF